MNGTIMSSNERTPQTPTIPTPRSEISSRRSEGDLHTKASQQELSAALLDLQSKRNDHAEAAAKLIPPCLFHRRFDDAVNLQKVLEEIAGDEGMSHSRLVLTATGVREVAKQLQRKPIKRAVRNVMIVTKARDNNLVTLTRDLAEWLLGTPRYGSPAGVNVYVDDKLRTSKRFNAAGLLAQNSKFESMLRYWTPDMCWMSPQQFDLVLTLGGDGTVLFTSWLFQAIVPPVLSFSLGSLGFLTPFDFAHHKEHLNRVMGGAKDSAPPSPQTGLGVLSPPASVISSNTPESGMRINLRMRFTCTVHRSPRNRLWPSRAASTASSSSPALSQLRSAFTEESPIDPRPAEQFEVLNELVIDRGPSPYVSMLHLYGDGQPLTTIQADGLILSTPTGSTAYSLSAGGSLVHPDIPAILLTPICPHTLSFRPMLLNDTMLLTVRIPSSSRANAWCSFDGKGRVELRQGDSVDIKASRYPFPTVVSSIGDQWVDSISRTLRWNTRGAQQKGWGKKRAAADSHIVEPPPPIDSECFDGVAEDQNDAATAEDEEEEYDIDIEEHEDTDSTYGGDTNGTHRGSTGNNSPLPGRKQGSMPYLSSLNI